MKERIAEIMKKEQLSPASFAESIGIQRSALSHILNGRNNPSLDVVMKIHQRYGYINLEWLLYGKGTMTSQENIKDGLQASLFDENVINMTESTDESEYRKEMPAKIPEFIPKEIVREQVKYVEKPQRKIIEIRIFFDDNTFEIFKGDK